MTTTVGADVTDPQLVTIGTGAPDGVYYPTGLALCSLLNRQRPEHGIGCVVQNTEGSIANLRALRAGEFDLALVQSDWQYHAFHGDAAFTGAGADPDLRALFSLYSEAFTVVARTGAGIETLDDLKGKRVNIGNPGSGQRATMDVIMKARGWDREDFAEVLELSPEQQGTALCDGQVDAIVYVVGHPNRSVLETTTTCDARLVTVAGPMIDALIATQPYYVRTTIPGGMYRGNPEPIVTFGGKATVVAEAGLPASVVYRLVSVAFDNIDELRRAHPALARLEPEAMATEGLTAPLHPGAERYYRETGLLPGSE